MEKILRLTASFLQAVALVVRLFTATEVQAVAQVTRVRQWGKAPQAKGLTVETTLTLHLTIPPEEAEAREGRAATERPAVRPAVTVGRESRRT